MGKRVCFIYNKKFDRGHLDYWKILFLAKMGYEVTVFSHKSKSLPTHQQLKPNVSVHRIFKKQLSKVRLYNFRALKAFFSIFCFHPSFNLVVVSCPSLFLVGLSLIQLKGGKLVYDSETTIQEFLDEELALIEAQKDNISPISYSRRKKSIQQFSTFVRVTVPNFSPKFVDRKLISNCDYTTNLFNNDEIRLIQYVFDKFSDVLPQSISRNTEFIQHRKAQFLHENQISPDSKILLFIGSIHKVNQIEHYINLIEGLDNTILVLSGKMNVPYFTNLFEFISRSPHLRDRVIYKNETSPEKQNELLAIADLILIPFTERGEAKAYCCSNKVINLENKNNLDLLSIIQSIEFKKWMMENGVAFDISLKETQSAKSKIQHYFSSEELLSKGVSHLIENSEIMKRKKILDQFEELMMS